MLPINYLAVIVSAVVAFIIGFLMHGPVFGKLWMRLANVHPTGNEKFSDMYGQMVWNLIANLVTAYVLAVIYLLTSTSPFMGMSAISNGLICAFLVWIGFIVTGSSMEVIWMKRSFKLWIFESFSSLLTLLAMGAIIAIW
ncbi:MAG: DUF1761 domain-containing protein [Patescibacteria group bacterium]